MTSKLSASDRVLHAFIEGANAQYREAGLDQYQMKLRSDGSVEIPKPDHQRSQNQTDLSAGKDQAASGAADVGATAPNGSAPQITNVRQVSAEEVKAEWRPIANAQQYGVWLDGELIGHVPNPAFIANIPPGASGTLMFDAVMPDQTRSERSAPINISVDATGQMKLQ